MERLVAELAYWEHDLQKWAKVLRETRKEGEISEERAIAICKHTLAELRINECVDKLMKMIPKELIEEVWSK